MLQLGACPGVAFEDRDPLSSDVGLCKDPSQICPFIRSCTQAWGRSWLHSGAGDCGNIGGGRGESGGVRLVTVGARVLLVVVVAVKEQQ